MAAARTSGWRVLEATAEPGGLCRTYFIDPQTPNLRMSGPDTPDSYRFEMGGGHWMFGVDQALRGMLEKYSSLCEYSRNAAVFFPETGLTVPYPIQNHLLALPKTIARRAAGEMLAPRSTEGGTLDAWLQNSFGPTLCELFFTPFHELYTAGLFRHIAPQDAQKSPVDLPRFRGAFERRGSPVGYNARYLYPCHGLGTLMKRIAEDCDVRYNSRATALDVSERIVRTEDGTVWPYESLLSTLSLDRTLALAHLDTDSAPDPYTSVCVLNIGACRGSRCPAQHWIYVPRSRSGFYRIGFYSNVTSEFLPKRIRRGSKYVSLYVERAYRGGARPSDDDLRSYADMAMRELQDWQFIRSVDVIDMTWIETAYTWHIPGSRWVEEGIALLAHNGIRQAGRYARWKFQGIADCFREGLQVGAELRTNVPHE